MTATTIDQHQQQIQSAKANLALVMIALGVPLVILASFGMLRQVLQQQQSAYSDASPVISPGFESDIPGIHPRKPNPLESPCLSSPVPVPTSVGPELGVKQPDPTEYRDGHNITIPGCGTMNDGRLHCWGGMRPDPAFMSQSDVDGYIDDDAAGAGFTTSNGGFTSHTNMARHIGHWTAPGYSTSTGLGD